eukprot:5804250-Karenia_brevis.AAC.1
MISRIVLEGLHKLPNDCVKSTLDITKQQNTRGRTCNGMGNKTSNTVSGEVGSFGGHSPTLSV